MSELKLTFDPTLSDALNIHIMKPKIIDLLILMGQSCALDDFGLAYEVVSNAEFLILAGHAPMIRPDPGPAHGAGAVLTQWNKSYDMKTLEKTGKIALRGILVSAHGSIDESGEVTSDAHDAIYNDATVRAAWNLNRAGFSVSIGTAKEAMPSAC